MFEGQFNQRPLINRKQSAQGTKVVLEIPLNNQEAMYVQ